MDSVAEDTHASNSKYARRRRPARTPSDLRLRESVRSLWLSIFCACAVLLWSQLASALTPPVFSKAFTLDTIGPGSTTTLTYTLINTDSVDPAADITFGDTLPAGVLIATPSNIATDCVNAVFGAPDGGSTISLSDARLGTNRSCTVSVDVTAATPGSFVSTSGDLTSSAGNSGTAADTLTVDGTRAGITMQFTPASANLGATTTVTVAVDNSLNPATAQVNLANELPPELRFANPIARSTGCTFANPIVDETTQTISAQSTFVAAGTVCSIEYDVKAVAAGSLRNASTSATQTVGFSTVDIGFASAKLEAVFPDALLTLDGAAAPGGQIVATYTLSNRDRDNAISGISFTHDLDAGLSGLAALTIPVAPCGAGSALSGSSSLSFTGGSIGPESSCSFEVTLLVPANAASGSYPLTSSVVNIGSSGRTFTPAQATLFVVAGPTVSKQFLTSPLAAGSDATIRFTLENTDTTNAVSDISFEDNLGSFLGNVVPFGFTLPPANFCGAGSTASLAASFDNIDTVAVSGASLAAGANCTFDVSFQLPSELSAGIYLNTTSRVSGTYLIDLGSGPEPVGRAGNVASAELTVVSAPLLAKSFGAPPILGGDITTVNYTLQAPADAPGDTTNIAFSDDIGSVLPGLVASGTPLLEVCGPGSQLTGTTILSLTGGTLAPGEACSFSVNLQVPAGAVPGVYASTAGNVTALQAGTVVTRPAGSVNLTITGVQLTASFSQGQAVAGELVQADVTWTNLDPTRAATDLQFSVSASAFVSGATLVGLPQSNVCGAGSAFAGSAFSASLSGGTLGVGESCTFSIQIQLPSSVTPGAYRLELTSAAASLASVSVSVPTASAALELIEPLLVSKLFRDDPVQPGDTVELEFTVENLAPAQAASNVAFTDDLTDALPGLTALGLPLSNPCGAGSSVTGTSTISLTGGTLAPASSCTFSVTVQVPNTVSFGTTITNTTSAVTGTVNSVTTTGGTASDDLTVNFFGFSKAFELGVAAGDTIELTYTVENLNDTNGATGLAFSDDFDQVIPGLVASQLPADGFCGAGSQVNGSSFLQVFGIDLAAGESCVFSVTLQVPAVATGGIYASSTSTLSAAGLPSAAPAEANLLVVGPPSFVKLFSPGIVALGQTSVLTYSIDNRTGVLPATDVNFAEFFPPGLEIGSSPAASTDCQGGTLVATPGSDQLSYSGGAVPAATLCAVIVPVVGVELGRAATRSELLTSSLGTSGIAAGAIEVVAPFLSKRFLSVAAPGQSVSLRFTLSNQIETGTASAISFSDDLDNVLAGLVATGLPLVDPCGAGSSLTGNSILTFTGGVLGAGETCSFDVTVQVPGDAAPGSYGNITGEVTALVGTVARTFVAASDGLEVAPAPRLTASFVDSPIAAGQTAELELTISNTDTASEASELEFSVDVGQAIPSAVLMPPDAGFCGPGATATLSGSVVTFASGSLPPGGSCLFSLGIEVPLANPGGDTTLTTGAVNGTVDGTVIAGAATSAQLSVIGAPVLSKSFTDDPVLPGSSVNLEFTLTNADATRAVSNLEFSDDLSAMLDGALATGLPLSDVCGPGSELNGSTTVTLSGGLLAPAASCTFSVPVQVPASVAAGDFVNLTSALSGDVLGVPVTGVPASEPLAVTGLEVQKEIAADTLVPGGSTRVTFTLTNRDGARPVSNITFSEDLSLALPGLSASDLPGVDPCGSGSTLTGSGVVTLSGGSLAAGGSCAFSFDLNLPAAAPPGSYLSATGPISAEVLGAPVSLSPAEDSFDVVPALSLTKSFSRPSVIPGGTVELEFTLENADPANTAVGLSFSDDLSAALAGLSASGLPETGVCGPASVLSGTSRIELVDGELAPGASCTFSVSLDVPAGLEFGTLVSNITSEVSAMLGGVTVTGTPAQAEFNVSFFRFEKVFESVTSAGGMTLLSFTIENLDEVSAATQIAFSDNLDEVLPGLTAVGQTQADVCGAGSSLSGSSELSLTNGSLAAGATCVFSVVVELPDSAAPGEFINTTSPLSVAGEVAANPATANLTVAPAPAFSKQFSPDSILTDETTVLAFTIDNSASLAEASDLGFSDSLPEGISIAEPAMALSTCDGGAFDVSSTAGAAADTVTYSGGVVAAGAICSLQVNVTSAQVGEYTSTSSELTSSLGNSGSASATLSVTTLDSDSDGVPDGEDQAPNNPNVCADRDNDGCDDCARTGPDQSGGDPANDGPDEDGDGICDAGETPDASAPVSDAGATDAGTPPSADDAGTLADAGAPPGSPEAGDTDAQPITDAGTTVAVDSGDAGDNSTSSSNDGGCGCDVPGRAPGQGWTLAFSLSLFLGWRRRRALKWVGLALDREVKR